MKTLILTVAAAAAVAVMMSGPARAGCHLVDCVEDTYIQPSQLKSASCETLWTLRNSIYKDARYCFQSDRAKEFFGNKGCKFTEQASVPLNDYQRHNVLVIRSVEDRKTCS